MTNNTWYLPTHTENLKYFLEFGLVCCKQGFKGSYVIDVMESYPAGYIPFFSEDNLMQAIAKSQEEDENLTRCIIELDMKQMTGLPAYGVTRENESEVFCVELSDTCNNADEVWSCINNILLQAPLPIQCIKSIYFENKEDKEKSLIDVGSLASDLFKIKSKIFNGKEARNDSFLMEEDSSSGRSSFNLVSRKIEYNKVSSIGGMLALMFYQTKNSRGSVECFIEASKLQLIEGSESSEYTFINNYFFEPEAGDDSYQKMYFDLINIISGTDSTTVGEVKKTLIDYLDGDNNHAADTRVYAKKMAGSLRRIEERILPKTPEEVFNALMEAYLKDKKNKILMILLMYFYRDSAETMLKYYHKNFSDRDYILFAMFFGISCGYLDLPDGIKKIKGLNYYISNRMAEYSQQESSAQNTANQGSFFKVIKPPKFLIKDVIKETLDEKLGDFVEWFAQHLDLDVEKILKWKTEYKSLICETKSVLKTKIEPVVSDTTKASSVLAKELWDDYIRPGRDSAESAAIEAHIVSAIEARLVNAKEWSVQYNGFSCDSKTTVTSSKRPKVKALIDIEELEQQMLVATIGNDKDLFDYNKVLEQYEKLKK